NHRTGPALSPQLRTARRGRRRGCELSVAQLIDLQRMIGGSKIDVVVPISRGPEIALAIDVTGRIPIGPYEDVRELLYDVVRGRVELSQVVTIEKVECALLARQHCQVWGSSWLVWEKQQS